MRAKSTNRVVPGSLWYNRWTDRRKKRCCNGRQSSLRKHLATRSSAIASIDHVPRVMIACFDTTNSCTTQTRRNQGRRSTASRASICGNSTRFGINPGILSSDPSFLRQCGVHRGPTPDSATDRAWRSGRPNCGQQSATLRCKLREASICADE